MLGWQANCPPVAKSLYKYVKCQALHDGSIHWALPVSRSQQWQTVLTENFMFLSDYVETLYNCWIHQVDHEYTTVFDFHT